MNKVEICGVNTSKLKVLTNDETNSLLNRVKDGDAAAREELINGNLRLVLSVIQKFTNRGENADDLFQVGCIGLMKAIDNFDTTLGVRFSTYGVPMIIGEIKRFLRDSNSLRVSRSMRDIAYKALVVQERITKERELAGNGGEPPTIDEIAVELDLPYRAVYFALNATGTVISLDETICDEGNKEIMMRDRVADTTPTADDWLEDLMLKRAIENLNEREREILALRYFEGKTQVEVSLEIGISQAQVSRLEKNALDGVKKRM